MDPNVRWLCVGGAVRVAGYTMIGSFFFLYLRNVLGLGYAEIGAIVTVTQILPVALLPVAGLATDRFGRRRQLLLSLVGEGGMLLLVAWALAVHSLVGLVVFITVLSAAGTIGGPAVWAYIADFVGGSSRTLGYTWLRVASNIGFTVGAIAGGVLIEMLGFVPVALTAGVMVLAVAVFLVLAIEPSPYDLARSGNAPAPTKSSSSRGPGSVSESLRTLFRDRTFLALCAAGGLLELTSTQWTVTVPLFVNTVLGVPYALVGIGLSLNGLVVVFGQGPMTRSLLGRRHTSLLAAGGLLYVVGFLLLGVPGLIAAAVLGAFFASVIVLSLGENVQSIPLTTLPSNMAPSSEIGSYNGTFSALSGIGTLLAPALGGLVLAFSSSGFLVWGLLALPTVPALVILWAYVTPRISAVANRA